MPRAGEARWNALQYTGSAPILAQTTTVLAGAANPMIPTVIPWDAYIEDVIYNVTSGVGAGTISAGFAATPAAFLNAVPLPTLSAADNGKAVRLDLSNPVTAVNRRVPAGTLLTVGIAGAANLGWATVVLMPRSA